MKVFIVLEPVSYTDGRGMKPMDCGYFLTEDEAWRFIGSRPGIMGRLPNKPWKDCGPLSDFDVKPEEITRDQLLKRAEYADRKARECVEEWERYKFFPTTK